jgi:hypothetical protein
MKISELIEKLKELKREHDDVPVNFDGENCECAVTEVQFVRNGESAKVFGKGPHLFQPDRIVLLGESIPTSDH